MPPAATTKAPAFQLYASDFMGDPLVDIMSPEALGGYFRLLLVAWQQDDPGYLPNDTEMLSAWSRLGERWDACSKAILRCFRTAPDGRLFQKRMVEVAREQAEYREQQRLKGVASGEARRKNREPTDSEPNMNSGSPPVEQRLNSGSPPVETQEEPKGNSPSPPPSPIEDLSSRTREDGPQAQPTAAEPIAPIGRAWSGARLPGLISGDDAKALARDLAMLGIDPALACDAWAKLVDHWHNTCGILVPPTPRKMREHLAMVHQIAVGKVDLKTIGKPSGSRASSDEKRSRRAGPIPPMPAITKSRTETLPP